MENKESNTEVEVTPIEGEITPTIEELQAQLKEANGFNEKLKSKLAKAKEEAPEKSEEAPKAKPAVKEEGYKPSVYEIAKLSETLSEDEIKLAESLVGTVHGSSLKEVSESAGFKATINAMKESKRDSDMMNLDGLELKPIETKISRLESIPGKANKTDEDKELIKELLKQTMSKKTRKKL